MPVHSPLLRSCVVTGAPAALRAQVIAAFMYCVLCHLNVLCDGIIEGSKKPAAVVGYHYIAHVISRFSVAEEEEENGHRFDCPPPQPEDPTVTAAEDKMEPKERAKAQFDRMEAASAHHEGIAEDLVDEQDYLRSSYVDFCSKKKFKTPDDKTSYPEVLAYDARKKGKAGKRQGGASGAKGPKPAKKARVAGGGGANG